MCACMWRPEDKLGASSSEMLFTSFDKKVKDLYNLKGNQDIISFKTASHNGLELTK